MLTKIGAIPWQYMLTQTRFLIISIVYLVWIIKSIYNCTYYLVTGHNLYFPMRRIIINDGFKKWNEQNGIDHEVFRLKCDIQNATTTQLAMAKIAYIILNVLLLWEGNIRPLICRHIVVIDINFKYENYIQTFSISILRHNKINT